MAQHLLVTNDFPPKTGGIQSYLYELWRRLEPGRAVVLTASSHPDAESFDRASGVQTERVASKLLFWPTTSVRRVIEAAIATHGSSVVLLDPVFPLGLIGPRLSKPFGVVLHGSELTVPARLPVVRWLVRRTLSRASVVICAGRYPEEEARRLVGAALPPVVQVPPGVDNSRFVPLSAADRLAARERFGIPPGAFAIVGYSRLVPRKGFDVLIRSMRQVAASVPHVLAQIGGAGRDRARLERLAASRSAPVTFQGRVADEDLPAWIAAGDLMVMDCRTRWFGLEREGFGIVFAEAAACGVPSVAGLSGGSDEAVRNGVTGTVVATPRRDDALATAIIDLASNEERRAQFAVAAREHAVRELDWDVLARRLSDGLRPFDQSQES